MFFCFLWILCLPLIRAWTMDQGWYNRGRGDCETVEGREEATQREGVGWLGERMQTGISNMDFGHYLFKDQSSDGLFHEWRLCGKKFVH